jgi:hypothetical protein
MKNVKLNHMHKSRNFLRFFKEFTITSQLTTFILIIFLLFTIPVFSQSFEGKFFSGEGDVEYLELLDIARRMFHPDPEYQNISMLYTPWWNGFVEGPTWDAWWIQNSYGPTYCALPFYEEPYLTFLQNAQDLWFDQMGDGQRIGARDWVAPDGSLCDAARPGWIMYKQGDGRIDIHDWGMEFTAAGLLLQSELLLIYNRSSYSSAAMQLLLRNICPSWNAVPILSKHAATQKMIYSWPGRPLTCSLPVMPDGNGRMVPMEWPI